MIGSEVQRWRRETSQRHPQKGEEQAVHLHQD
jgi:hypothetical protein